METGIRKRNPRGEGSRLRAELIAAAAALLEETGSEDAVTLRAVARRAGVTPTSIYPHFADPGAILTEVIRDAFAALTAELRAADQPADNADQHLTSVCVAYIKFAETHPDRYRVMFARHGRDRTAAMTAPRSIPELGGADTFGVLVQAVARRSAQHGFQSDPQADATALWVAIHGLVTLRDAVPAFPWPDDMLPTLITRLTPTH